MSNLIGISFLDLKLCDDDSDQADCFSLFGKSCMACRAWCEEAEGLLCKGRQAGSQGC